MIFLKVKLKKYEIIFDFLFITLGSAVFSAAVAFLLEPAEITPGGLTGISVIFNKLFYLPTGVTLSLLNIPLILLGLKKLGLGFVLKTALSVVLTSVFLDLFEGMKNPFNFDIMISAIFGGILLGTGLGVVMLRGASTGGVDIAVKLINRRYRTIPLGRLFLIIDSVIIIFAAAVYSNIETALYSAIAIFISSQTIDLLLYGNTGGRIFFIITEKEDEMRKTILASANRGATLIHAEGGYTGNVKSLVLCAARVGQIKKIRRLVLECDPKAFFFIANVSEINGEGFDRPD